MKNAYFISGLAAQCRIFDKIELPEEYKRHYLEFIIPNEEDDLASYALRLGKDIAPNSIVIGLSLGGMMATEIAKSRPDITAILLSSIPVKSEFPKYLSFLLQLKLNQYLSKEIVGFFFNKMKSIFMQSNLTSSDEKLLMDMFNEGDFDFFLWCIEAIKLWNNKYYPSNIIRIHGTNDRVLPLKNKEKIDCIIKGGSHVMLLENHNEINSFLRKIL